MTFIIDSPQSIKKMKKYFNIEIDKAHISRCVSICIYDHIHISYTSTSYWYTNMSITDICKIYEKFKKHNIHVSISDVIKYIDDSRRQIKYYIDIKSFKNKTIDTTQIQSYSNNTAVLLDDIYQLHIPNYVQQFIISSNLTDAKRSFSRYAKEKGFRLFTFSNNKYYYLKELFNHIIIVKPKIHHIVATKENKIDLLVSSIYVRFGTTSFTYNKQCLIAFPIIGIDRFHTINGIDDRQNYEYTLNMQSGRICVNQKNMNISKNFMFSPDGIIEVKNASSIYCPEVSIQFNKYHENSCEVIKNTFYRFVNKGEDYINILNLLPKFIELMNPFKEGELVLNGYNITKYKNELNVNNIIRIPNKLILKLI